MTIMHKVLLLDTCVIFYILALTEENPLYALPYIG